MRNRTSTITIIGLMILPMALYAQPPGAEGFPGPEEKRRPTTSS